MPAPGPMGSAAASESRPRGEPVDRSAGALQLLAMFQREGRLIDFLRESIDCYDDATIGAAARDIHRGLRKVLEEHFVVEPVVGGQEDEPFTVDAQFDPQRIRLVGNVAGRPPFRGVLRHHGWRAAEVRLPSLGDGVDHTIVAPAEVEV